MSLTENVSKVDVAGIIEKIKHSNGMYSIVVITVVVTTAAVGVSFVSDPVVKYTFLGLAVLAIITFLGAFVYCVIYKEHLIVSDERIIEEKRLAMYGGTLTQTSNPTILSASSIIVTNKSGIADSES